ncbi:MAG: DUF2231 domain-containing protein [Candidatus Zixiibacteriota bacterium]
MSAPLHPMLVHFPIALVLLVAALDGGRWFFDRDRLLGCGFWDGTTPILIAAMVAAMAAIASGLAVESSVHAAPRVMELIEAHELAAFGTAGLVSILALWRMALRGGFPRKGRWAYLVLITAAVLCVAYGAYLGGEMAFANRMGVMDSGSQ